MLFIDVGYSLIGQLYNANVLIQDIFSQH